MTTRTRRRELGGDVVAEEFANRGGRCALCGTELAVGDVHWHHVAVKRVDDGSGGTALVVDKVDTVSNLRGGGGDALEAELAKCIPLCGRPCHLEICHGHPPLRVRDDPERSSDDEVQDRGVRIRVNAA